MGRAGPWAEGLTPLVAGMTATPASLLAWVGARAGVAALREVFVAEAAALAGPKGQHLSRPKCVVRKTPKSDVPCSPTFGSLVASCLGAHLLEVAGFAGGLGLAPEQTGLRVAVKSGGPAARQTSPRACRPS